jgi:hypothetical protein
MTDEQIINAYEGLTPRQQLSLYRNMYYKDGNATERGVIANAINDILPEYERQKAEIKRKDRIIESYALQYGTAADKEVFLRKARAEAIREFAERLFERVAVKTLVGKSEDYSDGFIEATCWYDEEIDNLVKEMTED